jgi:hypothetical protein
MEIRAGKDGFSTQIAGLDKQVQARMDDVKNAGDAVTRRFSELKAKEIKRQLDFYSILSGNQANAKIASAAFTDIEKDIRNLGRSLKGSASPVSLSKSQGGLADFKV